MGLFIRNGLLVFTNNIDIVLVQHSIVLTNVHGFIKLNNCFIEFSVFSIVYAKIIMCFLKGIFNLWGIRLYL